MTDQEINNLIDQKIKDAAQSAQYGVTRVPVHTHNNIDSPNLNQHSVTGFQTLAGITGGVANPDLLNGQTISFGDTTNTSTTVPNIYIYPLPIIYGYGTVGGAVTIYYSLTATGSLSIGATTATLTAVWPYASSTHDILFSNGDTKTVTVTNGSASISWTGGLSSGATSALLMSFLPGTFGTTTGISAAKLSSNYGGTTGNYAIQFSNGEVRIATFTNGSVDVTWTPALERNALSTTTQINNARFHSGTGPDGTALVFRNDDDGILQLWVRTAAGSITDTWAYVDLAYALVD